MYKTRYSGYHRTMPRNCVTEAIVFSVKPLGELNSSVCFLTKERGIVYATLYGGAKSKLRSLVSVWNSGTAYFYCKEADNFERNVKVTDFDVRRYHLSFRENLYKSYAASLAAELIIKTKCAGSFESCWRLASGFFDGLEIAEGGQCERGLVRFLWRYMELLGIQSDAASCASCGRSFAAGNLTGDAVVYSTAENGFLCSACAAREESAHRITLSLGALRYLDAVSRLSPHEARSFEVSDGGLGELKRLVFFLSEQAAGTKLQSLATGMGIL